MVRPVVDALRERGLVEPRAVTQWGADTSTAAAHLALSALGREEAARAYDEIRSEIPPRVELTKHRLGRMYAPSRWNRVPVFVACECGAAWSLLDERSGVQRANWWRCPKGHNADTE